MLSASTTITSKPLNKGITIGSSTSGSSLKPPSSKKDMEGKEGYCLRKGNGKEKANS